MSCARPMLSRERVGEHCFQNAKTAVFFSFVRSNLTVMSGTSDFERLRRDRAPIRCSRAATRTLNRKFGLVSYGDRLNSHVLLARTTRRCDPRLPNFCAAPCAQKRLSIGQCKAYSPGLAALASPVQGSAARPHQTSPVTV